MSFATVVLAVSLWVAGVVGASEGTPSCGISIDASTYAGPKQAGDALIDQVFDADPGGCAQWQVDLSGTFHLDRTLLWDFEEPLVIAGPDGDGTAAHLQAIPFGAAVLVTHRIVTAEPPDVPDATVGPVTLRRIVVTGGAVQSGVTDNAGGAVLADVVHLVDSAFEDNTAATGGAVSARTVHAERVSFVNNRAITGTAVGGAIRATEHVELENVTLRDNAASSGGAIWLPTAATFTATFVTFVDNAADTGAHLLRALEGDGPVTLRGVLFGSVDAATAGTACGGGEFPAAGAGLSMVATFATDGTCGDAVVVPDLVEVSSVPFLAGASALPVFDATSSAIAEVECADGLPDVDQRGVARPQGERCDAGAVEREVTVTVMTLDPDDPDEPPAAELPEPPAPGDVPAEDEGWSALVPRRVPAGDGTCADGCPAFTVPPVGPVPPH